MNYVPLNLISLFTASGVVSQKLAGMRSNESIARWKMEMIANAQAAHKMNAGRFGSLEELKAAGHLNEEDESLEATGYKIKFSVSGDTYEATATPTGYPRQGRRSFYVDQTGTLRGGDTGGKPASASDPEIAPH